MGRLSAKNREIVSYNELAKQLFPKSREEVLRNFPERAGYEVVDKPIPFAQSLTAFFIFHGINLIKESQAFALPYRGFDFVRRGDNLLTEALIGTGFEGYSIGRFSSGEDAVNEIAAKGKEKIDYLKQIHPGVWPTIMRELWQALDGRKATSRALEVLNQLFVWSLSEGREEIQGNPQAKAYRENTLATVSALPRVDFYYDQSSGVVHNVYYRPKKRRPLAGIKIDRYTGDPERHFANDPALLDGWRLMSKLGLLGQMAVRVAEQHGYLQGSPSRAVAANAGIRAVR